MKTYSQDVEWERGHPTPLGASLHSKGVNFSLFSEHAESVTLCLFAQDSKHPFLEIRLHPNLNKTGMIWHILVKGIQEMHIEYGYKISGPDGPEHKFNPKAVLSDPYAKGLNTCHQWGYRTLNKESAPPRGKAILDAPFDWEGDQPPKIPMEDLIIYEMHVRSFTAHPSSKTETPGSFLGIIEKIPYLKQLGINAIELMPIFEFNECELNTIHPGTQAKLKNVWGYSTINFFTPMNRYCSSSGWTASIDEFRTLVKELHKNGIEIYLDVVYNHTAEGNENGPVYSFKGIDNSAYYILNSDGSYGNYSGTGNTFSANHPAALQLILDSLRYWVSEMHVDGFRFDLASCLTRDSKGHPLPTPPLIEAINNDPILAEVKLIAEAWDAAGLYQVGNFPGGDRWAEWNGKYRDSIRRFIKGSEGESGHFASAMSGSEDLYGKWGDPRISINFVTAHDGFTLADLVSYQEKHNEENGEENRDGANQNDSWNCGVEGPTANRKIQDLRDRQMRNFHCALMLAIGTPMLLMGDEYKHTRRGNNNTYCQDNELNWFLWDQIEKKKNFFRFYRLMIAFRKKNSILRRRHFLSKNDVDWHGLVPLEANWSGENRFIAYTLRGEEGEALYIAFNAHFEPVQLQLPPPPKGKRWYRVVDTGQPPPQDFCESPKEMPPLKETYKMVDYSTFIAQAF